MNKFRHRKTNQRLQKHLFKEFAEEEKSYILYTLKDKDETLSSGEILPSLYKAYLDFEDLTEWNFAHQYFESYEHWMMIANSYWFKEYIERFRKDLDLKMKAIALTNIQAVATKEDSTGFAANKYLLEKGWIPKEHSRQRRGRPSKDEIQREAKQLAETKEMIDSTYDRIFKDETSSLN